MQGSSIDSADDRANRAQGGTTTETTRLVGKWKPKPADVVVRRPRRDLLRPVHIQLTPPREPSTLRRPSLILIYAFAILIALGTLLLSMPFSHHGSGFAPFIDALFTATSAGTVTGLIIQDTGTYWTLGGQAIILFLMFIGGLGIMTIASALFVLAGQRMSLTQRLVVRETVGTAAFTDITRVTVRIVLWAVAIQFIGFLILTVQFMFYYPPLEAVWHGLFQGVSGFNNAGFVSLPQAESLVEFRSDLIVIGVIGLLIVLGSISYWVIDDVVKRRGWSRLALNSKLVLVFTAGLLIAGTVGYYLGELGNSETFGRLNFADQVIDSVFHSINRTSGFSTGGFANTRDETNLFYSVLMFIGGASASVAGGIKVNTFAIVVIAIVATMLGRSRTSAFGRRVPVVQVKWALVVVTMSFLCTYLVALLLAFLETEYAFIDLLFESVSAFGTVGFSTGITANLSVPSQILLSIAMFVGRVGPPMAIVIALSRQDDDSVYRYTRERVTMG